MVALAGLDAHRFLVSDDPLEVRVMQLVAKRTLELGETVDRNRATLIANAVGKMLSGK